MVDFDIPQEEADLLISLPKIREETRQYHFPGPGGDIRIPLLSQDKRIKFNLDIARARIDLTSFKYQNRAHQIIILVRIDASNKSHMNPDGELIPGPHIHLYREGFGDKWAYPIPRDRFPNITDRWALLKSFEEYCNIVEPPIIIAGIE